VHFWSLIGRCLNIKSITSFELEAELAGKADKQPNVSDLNTNFDDMFFSHVDNKAINNSFIG